MELPRFCRACAREVKQPCEIENNPAKPELPLLLKRYVPEFNVKVENACLCIDCASVLDIFHNFKRQCLRLEQDVRLYARKHPELKRVNLTDISLSKEQGSNIDNFLKNTAMPKRPIKKRTTEPTSQTITTKFACKICYSLLQTEEDLRLHIRKHSKVNSDETSTSKKQIINDASESKQQPHVETIFTTAGDVTVTPSEPAESAQQATTSTTKRKMQCNACHRVFATKQLLSRHIRVKHDGEHHQCDKCKRIFSTLYRYKEHMAYHKRPDAGRFACKVCTFVYHSLSALSRHKDSVHLLENQKPFGCEMCGKRFNGVSKLCRHMKQVHKRTRALHTYTTALRTESDGRVIHNIEIRHIKVKCKLCSRLLASEASLSGHNRRFHARQRYKCGQCGRAFASKRNYNAHLEYHKKPSAGRYVCEECNFVYQGADTLNSHMIRIHRYIREETT